MSIVKSGLSKDAVWFLMVLFAFGAGWGLRKAPDPIPEDDRTAAARSAGATAVTALPKPRSLRAAARPTVPATSMAGSNGEDPVASDLLRRVDELEIVEKLAHLAKADFSTAPDAAHLISSTMNANEVPMEALVAIFQQYLKADTDGAITWLDTMPARLRESAGVGMVRLVHDWAGRNPAEARRWLRSREGRSNYEMLSGAFVLNAFKSNPGLAEDVAETMPAGDLRENAMRLVEGGLLMSTSVHDTEVRMLVVN